MGRMAKYLVSNLFNDIRILLWIAGVFIVCCKIPLWVSGSGAMVWLVADLCLRLCADLLLCAIRHVQVL